MSDTAHAAIFTLRIEGITPADLPMRRLAAYLDELARLLGEEESIRFEGVVEGSTKIAARPLSIAVPKVRARLNAARDCSLEDASRSANRLDTMLSDDNASGTLSEEGQPGVIIRFPGAKARVNKLPIISETGSIQGEVVRVGGRDETKHATLRDHSKIYSCTVSEDLARSLGKLLFGPAVRLYGRGRWRRMPDGEWELIDFRASHIEHLDDATLAAAAEKLRATGGLGHTDPGEAKDALQALRAE